MYLGCVQARFALTRPISGVNSSDLSGKIVLLNFTLGPEWFLFLDFKIPIRRAAVEKRWCSCFASSLILGLILGFNDPFLINEPLSA